MSKGPKAKRAKPRKTGKAKAAVKSKPAPAPEAPVQAEAARLTEVPDTRPGAGKRIFGLIAFPFVFAGSLFVSWPLWSPILAPYFSGLGDGPAETPALTSPKKEASKKEAPGNEASLQEMTSERQRMQGELNRLMARMESIENSIEEVKKMIHATAGPADDGGPDPSLQALAERLDALERGGETAKTLLKRMDRLVKDGAARLAAAGPKASGGSARAQALVLAVANLREAIARDGPYMGALDSLKAVARDDPDVKAAALLLRKTAKTGIPTLATLSDRFDGLAGKIVHASRTLDEKGWMERAANRITSLVTWRRVDDSEKGTSVDAVVARAEARLRAGDLQAAVKALEGLSGNEKAAFKAAPWLGDAKARVGAERAVATLHVHAISLLIPVKE